MRRIIPALILISALSACDAFGGGGGEDSQVTETRMDDLDSLEGTISDEMVDTDTINEQPMIDASSPTDAKSEAKKADSGEKPVKAETKAEPAATTESAKTEGE